MTSVEISDSMSELEKPVAEVEKRLQEVSIDQNIVEEKSVETKSQKKKKNKKKAAVEEKKEEVVEESKEEVVEGKENVENANDLPVCAHCKKTDPKKRCSKRHPKCLKKMFCNETCEGLAHEDRKAAVVKKEAAKVANAKKKAGSKIKNWKNTDSGQFWWHDQ